MEILSGISALEGGSEEQLKLEKERLKHHREGMHPGCSFTKDNADIMVKPRQTK